MSIGQVLLILWRRGWIAVLALLASVAVAAGVLLFIPGRYDATATASIDISNADPINSSSLSASLVGLMEGNLAQLVLSQRVAIDVVKRLNLTANPATQAAYRRSDSFGRESIDEWMASSISGNVVPGFAGGSSVLTIKYKSGDPNQAALMANAFLAAAVDATIAMKVAGAEQTAQWFAPQIEALHKEFEEARSNVEAYQRANGELGADTQGAALNAVTQQLLGAKATLSALKNRLDTGSIFATDPGDPDFQTLTSMKDKVTALQTELEAGKATLGSNNPKMQAAQVGLATLRKEIADLTTKTRENLKSRISLTENQIASLEVAKVGAEKDLIAEEAQRNRLGEMQREVGFRLEQMNERERVAAQAKLQSKLTFADIAVLDKAVPPTAPSFPKPLIVLPVAIGAGLTLGIILALLAEMLDRRVRLPSDLTFATSAPVLGVVKRSSLGPSRYPNSTARLRAA